MNKQEFLTSIRKPDGSLKRTNGVSPIRYPGGKTRAIGQITNLMPDSFPRKILSPFVGGASLEITWANNLDVDEVVGCDIHLPVVNFWQVILTTPDDLAEELRKLAPTRPEYIRVKEMVVQWYKGQLTLDPIVAAAYYFHNTQLSYGPMFPGYVADSYLTQPKWDAMVGRVSRFRCPKLRVELRSFQESLKQYPNHYVYADPPYLLGYDSTVTYGLYPNRNWPTDHVGFQHIELRDLLKVRKNGWMLSYNDCGTIRSWYDSYEFHYPTWQYSFQQGETRVNGVKGLRDNSKESREIVIISPGNLSTSEVNDVDS